MKRERMNGLWMKRLGRIFCLLLALCLMVLPAAAETNKRLDEIFKMQAQVSGGTMMASGSSYQFLEEDTNYVPGNPNLLRKDITYIHVLASTWHVPANAWDMSQEQNRSVLAWTEKLDNGYNLYIAADGRVKAPVNGSGLFAGYVNLEGLYLNGNLDTSATKDFNAMFEYLESITSLDLSSLDTSSATDMGSMFWGCEKLESLNLAGFNTSNVEFMGCMFNRCESLRVLDLTSFDTSRVISMNAMFRDCKKLWYLDLRSFNTWGVSNMKEMFKNTQSLENLQIGDGFGISASAESKDIFSGCALYDAYLRDKN